jgi:hypothetical protein
MKTRTKQNGKNHNGNVIELKDAGRKTQCRTRASLPRNKVAKLALKVRVSINEMLRDRVPYEQILVRLGDVGKDLNKDNLSRWKKNEYRTWLGEEQRREASHAKIRFLLGLVQDKENAKILQASQQIGALQVADVIADLDVEELKRTFQSDPANYVRLLNALPRLSGGGLSCEKHRDEKAAARAESKKHGLNEEGGLRPETLRKIEEQIGLL